MKNQKKKDVYNYEIVYGADWRTPDGTNNSIDNLPVTQVSYNDALEYKIDNSVDELLNKLIKE